MSSSLLAHLIPRVTAAEPAATRALAYILNSAPEIASTFADVLGQIGAMAFEPGRIDAEERHGNCVPDLTVRDAEGAVRALVENKFWAGLTAAQPVSYMEQLPSSALLAFIVPHTRMHSIWAELRDRCADSKIELDSETRSNVGIAARSGRRTLAITSWKHVLERLRQAAISAGHSMIEQDIVQLRGLTDQQNTDEFLPLRDDEVTDASLSRRLINYSQLIDEVAERLVADGIADTKKCARSVCDFFSAGRGVRLRAKFGVWVGVDFDAWRRFGITPFWLELSPTDGFSGIGKTPAGTIVNALPGAEENESTGFVCVPIRLKTAVERDRVLDAMVEQIRDIADSLGRAVTDSA